MGESDPQLLLDLLEEITEPRRMQPRDIIRQKLSVRLSPYRRRMPMAEVRQLVSRLTVPLPDATTELQRALQRYVASRGQERSTLLPDWTRIDAVSATVYRSLLRSPTWPHAWRWALCRILLCLYDQWWWLDCRLSDSQRNDIIWTAHRHGAMCLHTNGGTFTDPRSFFFASLLEDARDTFVHMARCQ